MIHDAGETVPSDMEADICIVGSGPGGSAAARTLARNDKSVILLETGKHHPPSSFTNRGLTALRELYADYGKRLTEGSTVMPFLLGQGLGGGTLVNSAICFRAPQRALERWSETAKLQETTREKLDPYMAEVEKTLGIQVLDLDKLGRNNTLFHEGLKRLGWKGAVIPRNAIDCAPCARCFYGCPAGAKRSTDKNFIQQAIEAGAKVFVQSRVNMLRVESGKVTSVLVSALKSGQIYGSFNVRAKHFVLAAGSVGTPKMLLRQKLANSSGEVGRNFRCHPTSGVLALFGEEVHSYRSIMQGYYSDEFFEQDEILLETVWAPAEAIATTMPGFGHEWMERIAKYKNLSAAGGMIREKGSGYVQVDNYGHAVVKYKLEEEDERRLTKALFKASEVLLAAGALEVYSDNPYTPVLRDIQQLREMERKHTNLGPTIIMEGNHAQGTCRMNADRRKGVVNEYGRTHDIPNLWIMDSSVFPEALGVNPQITIMALAMRNAEYLAGNA